MLWAAGEIDLHDAVDELQASAERGGLVAELGQDRVQEIMVEAFAPLRDDLTDLNRDQGESMVEISTTDTSERAPTELTRPTRQPDPHIEKLRRLMAADVSLERAWAELNKQTPASAAKSTVEALMFSLRERGTAALAEPECRRRLAALSIAQVREVLARLMTLRPNYPAIDDELLFLVGEQL